MYNVHRKNKKNKQKEWHRATKPPRKERKRTVNKKKGGEEKSEKRKMEVNMVEGI
jgi:hypothetical protein